MRIPVSELGNTLDIPVTSSMKDKGVISELSVLPSVHALPGTSRGLRLSAVAVSRCAASGKHRSVIGMPVE